MKLEVLTPRKAYKLWASSYDERDDNALLWLEEKFLVPILETIEIQERSVIDFGCGTGRYLERLVARRPISTLGLDTSRAMLQIASGKLDSGSVQLLNAGIEHLPLCSEKFDVGLCTLVLGAVVNLDKAVSEMCRVLKPGAVLVVSEFHPEADSRGWKRTFSLQRGRILHRTFAVRNYARPVSEYQRSFEEHGMMTELLVEPRIDESLRPFFARGRKEAQFEQAVGTPILFILKLRKR